MLDKTLDIITVLTSHKERLESLGHKVAYISLYGSQNYEMDINTEEYQSDIDTKAIIVPTLDDLIYNSKPISTSIEMESGICDVKDIRIFFDTLVKANPAYIETLFSPYFITGEEFTHEMMAVRIKRDELLYALRAQFCRATYGMMCEKRKALTHPYPSIIDKIEKYGFDGKQLHHIIRLYLMMGSYFVGKKPLDACLVPDNSNIELLINSKLNKFSLEYALSLADSFIELGKELKTEILANIDESTIDYSVKTEVLNLSRDIIKKKIISEIRT